MSGFVVARQLRQTRPGLDAILIARLDKPGEACERYPIKKLYNHSLGNSARIARSRSFANELGRTKVEVLDSRASPLQLGSDSKRTILLVEDHFDTRWCAASYLRLVGYRVLEAVNANEAFDLVNSGIDIDLVFSDVNMPGGENGYYLARWLAQHRPTLPVLLTSGEAQDLQALHPSPLRQFIRKPYEPGCVQQIVQLMLDGPGGD